MLDDQATALEEASAGQLAQAPPTPNMDGLSYEEYFKRLHQMVELVRQNWKLGQRVKTLKVVIQLTKLLADSSQTKLYSRKFKLVTDCLDEFGRLVHDRVHSIAEGSREGNQQTSGGNNDIDRGETASSKPQDLNKPAVNADKDVNAAKDVCRNWFLKVASIRELVPRFYVELAILEAYDILFSSASSSLAHSIEEQFFVQTLRRLTRAAWGFGDPIVALHARAYLCKVAQRLIGWSGVTREAHLYELIFSNLKSCAKLIGHLDANSIVGASTRHWHHAASSSASSFEMSMHFDLISSPIQLILNVVRIKYELDADESGGSMVAAGTRLARLVNEIADQQTFGDSCTFKRNILLHSLFRSIPNDMVAAMAGKFTERLLEAAGEWRRAGGDMIDLQAAAIDREKTLAIPSIYATLTSFLIALDGSDSWHDASNQEEAPLKGRILNTSDELLNELLNFDHNRVSKAYLRCFKALVSFASHYHDDNLDKLLTNFVSKIQRGRQYVNHYLTLLDIIKTLFTNRTRVDEFKRIFVSRAFCQLFELLRKDEHKFEASKWILETMRSNIKLNHKAEVVTISDHLSINFILKLFASINDSLSPLTAADDLRHLSDLVIFFLNIIAVDDPSERLELYSRCRKGVGNLNYVLEHLIRVVLALPNEYRKLAKRKGARQDFLNGCLAFAFATTPAVLDKVTQVKLYQMGCELALNHMSLSLADYFMEQIMHNISLMLFPVQQEQAASETESRSDCQDKAVHWACTRSNQVASDDRMRGPLKQHLSKLLRMVVQHRDHVDLKHQLALASTCKRCLLFSEEPDTIETLSKLNCAVEDMRDNFNNDAGGVCVTVAATEIV